MKKRLLFLFVLIISVSILPQDTFSWKPKQADVEDILNDDDDATEEQVSQEGNKDDGISDIEIYVNTAGRKLFLYKGGKLVTFYDVAVGAPGFPTPRGDFEVIFGISNPDWTPPNSPWAAGSHYEPPGPKSATGIAKLYLKSPGVHIHGTPNDGSIGQYASHGCIRMHNSDVVALLEYILKNVAHTKPGRSADMTNEEYFEMVKDHPYTKYSATLNETVFVHTYYKRVEIINGQIYIFKDGYRYGGDVLKMIGDELIAQGYKIENLNWDTLAAAVKNVNQDQSFDIGELDAKASRSVRYSRVQTESMDEMR